MTIEEVTAKMKKTHRELIQAIRVDLMAQGFSSDELKPIDEHTRTFTKYDGQWYIKAENYKQATNDVLQAKLQVYADAMKSSGDAKKRESAAALLLKPGDAESLEIGLAVLLQDPSFLQQPEFERMLKQACSEHVPRLYLKDKQLKCALPACVLTLLCEADSYDLSGNEFNGVAEGDGTMAAGILYKAKNLSAMTEIDWCGRTHSALSAGNACVHAACLHLFAVLTDTREKCNAIFCRRTTLRFIGPTAHRGAYAAA
jgi:hypothetical protein